MGHYDDSYEADRQNTVKRRIDINKPILRKIDKLVEQIEDQFTGLDLRGGEAEAFIGAAIVKMVELKALVKHATEI